MTLIEGGREVRRPSRAVEVDPMFSGELLSKGDEGASGGEVLFEGGADASMDQGSEVIEEGQKGAGRGEA